jgi:TPR repeat protein
LCLYSEEEIVKTLVTLAVVLILIQSAVSGRITNLCRRVVAHYNRGGAVRKTILAMLTALLLSAGMALAGPLEDADAALVRKDYVTALGKYRSLAIGGNGDAQFMVGKMYNVGLGKPQNYAEAVMWYKLAAAQGNAMAQFNLGTMYGEGKGVVQDYPEAVKWYKLAAAQGNAMAQSNLGVIYGNGEGVVPNYAESVKWFKLAAAQGNAMAQSNLGMK